jgi:low temperature requirement protein LtrA
MTGATFAEAHFGAEALGAFVVSFVGSVAMWSIYFNIGAERASHQISHARDPGALARAIYTYVHVLIVAGIILAAVGDELSLKHPNGHAHLSTVVVILGAPFLYLLGNLLFKRASSTRTKQRTPLSHLVGLGLLVLLAPLGTHLSPLLLNAATTLILVVVSVWEWLSLGRQSAAAGELA